MNGNGTQKRRVRILAGFIMLGALLVIARLYYLQIIRGDDFRERAERQYANVVAASSDLNRGSIYLSDKDGNTTFGAILKTGYELSLNPSIINNPEDVYNLISGVMDFDEALFMEKASKEGDTYEKITDRLDEEMKDKIKALDIQGVNLSTQKWRFYPNNEMAAHVLGFVGYVDENSPLTGVYGLERYYNDVLERSAESLYRNFFAEIFLNVKGGEEGENLEGDIITSIEPTVEAELEKKLMEINAQWASDLTGGIVMDPVSGEIYAMGILPTFDPNYPTLQSENRIFSNPIVSNVYEMGSIIKPLAMAAAFDAGAVNANTTYTDTGSIILNTATIRNFDNRARGPGVTMQRVLSESLNVGMAFVASQMGNEKLREYFTNLGFGEETGIDLPNEVHGLVDNLKSPRAVELATASFGQGIALTPIATVRALSALANDGILPNPHVTKRIEYKTGLKKEISFKPGPQVFKKETTDEITGMLVKVVDEALLGGTVKLPNHTIAAKTGTAQMARQGERGYYDDRYLHSFFGYFPAYEPRFIIFLFTVYPKGATYASNTLAMPFIDLAKFLINYYNIPPDR